MTGVQEETARRIVDAEVRLERLETLEPQSGGVHYSLVVFVKSPTAGSVIARFRARPGSGRKYTPVRWCLDCYPDGSISIDIHKGTSCTPTSSATGGNKPSMYLARCKDGNCNGWSAWNHDDHIMIDVESVTALTEVGLTIELAPT